MPNPNTSREAIVDKNGKHTFVHKFIGKITEAQSRAQRAPTVSSANTSFFDSSYDKAVSLLTKREAELQEHRDNNAPYTVIESHTISRDSAQVMVDGSDKGFQLLQEEIRSIQNDPEHVVFPENSELQALHERYWEAVRMRD